MIINLKLAIIVTIFCMLILPTILFVLLKNKPKALKICAAVLFAVYLVFLFIGTTASISLKSGNVYIAFNFDKEWFSMDFSWFGLTKINTLINLFLLFPVGFVTYVFSNKHQFLKTILFSLAISLIIETYQFVLPIHRNTEVSDVIFNTLSGLISATYCEALNKILKRNKKWFQKKNFTQNT